MTITLIREKLYRYIQTADDKKLKAIYTILENDIAGAYNWWEDEAFVKELDSRYEALETGKDKGVTMRELETSIDKLRKRKHGK